MGNGLACHQPVAPAARCVTACSVTTLAANPVHGWVRTALGHHRTGLAIASPIRTALLLLIVGIGTDSLMGAMAAQPPVASQTPAFSLSIAKDAAGTKPGDQRAGMQAGCGTARPASIRIDMTSFLQTVDENIGAREAPAVLTAKSAALGLTGLFGVYVFARVTMARGRRKAPHPDDTDEARLRLFIDGAPAAIAMLDRTMRYIVVSRRFVTDHHLVHHTSASLIGRSHYDLFPEIPERWRAIHQRVLAGEPHVVDDDPITRLDGTVCWNRWEMVPWHQPDGKVGGALLFVEDVTARKRAESALRESEDRLRMVQEVGNIASYDRKRGAEDSMVNALASRLHDLPPDRNSVTHEEWMALVHPDDRERVEAIRNRHLEEGGERSFEFRICRPDGEVRWVHLRAEVFLGADGLMDRVVLAQQDITEIVTAREAKIKAEALFHQIVNSQFQHIALLGLDGTVLEANHAILESTGLTPEQLFGMKIWDVVGWSAADHDRLPIDMARVAQGEVIRREIEFNNADGRQHRLDLSLKPLYDATTNAVIAILAESQDLTEVLDLTTQLAQAHKLRALGLLAGGIAHDFNNILQTISGAAHLIERKPEDHERSLRLAGMTIAATQRGMSITQRLLSFARRGELRVEAIDTGELIDNMREVLAHTLGTKITVDADVPRGIPDLLADRPQLETAIINLGTNARDAMPDGGNLLLSVDVEHVANGEPHEAGLSPGDYVRISVTDTGTGMDAAMLSRVSEPFFTTKQVGQGTGLGIPMVKGFAEQSGGAMSISSTVGVGTTVVLWLPQARDTRPPMHQDDKIAVVASPGSLRILLVDDDDPVRQTLAAELESEGFSTTEVSSGFQALALIEAGEVVDAMVTDLSMPGMNGLTAIQRAHELRPDLPCFLLTGFSGERSALSADNDFTLVRKPVAGRALAMRIEAIVRAGT